MKKILTSNLEDIEKICALLLIIPVFFEIILEFNNESHLYYFDKSKSPLFDFYKKIQKIANEVISNPRKKVNTKIDIENLQVNNKNIFNIFSKSNTVTFSNMEIFLKKKSVDQALENNFLIEYFNSIAYAFLYKKLLKKAIGIANSSAVLSRHYNNIHKTAFEIIDISEIYKKFVIPIAFNADFENFIYSTADYDGINKTVTFKKKNMPLNDFKDIVIIKNIDAYLGNKILLTTNLFEKHKLIKSLMKDKGR